MTEKKLGRSSGKIDGGPEGLREEEEAGEAHGVGGVVEEESSAVAEIGGISRWLDSEASEEARKVGGSNRIVEDVLADEEIGGVDEERSVDLESGTA